jgi:hypothetical protein
MVEVKPLTAHGEGSTSHYLRTLKEKFSFAMNVHASINVKSVQTLEYLL